MKENYDQANQPGHFQIQEISLDSVLEFKLNKKQHGKCIDHISSSGMFTQVVEIECSKQFKIVMRMDNPFKAKSFTICSVLE